MRRLTTGKKVSLGTLALAGAMLLVFASAGIAGKIQSFTADQVLIDETGTTQSGKMYVTPQKMRVDVLTPQGPKNMVMIFRRDLKKQYMMNTGKKIYVEMAIDEAEMEKASKKYIKGQNEKILGTETVSGYKCTKKQVDTTVEVMGYKHQSTSMVWTSDKFEMPLRTKSQEGMVTELRNIEKGAPSAQVFEVPGGYEKSPNMLAFMATVMGDGESAGEAGGEQPSALPFKLPKGLKIPGVND